MPAPDPIPGMRSGRALSRARLRLALDSVADSNVVRVVFGRGGRKRKRGGGLSGEPIPVEPNRPNDLSGGAAAALEFDD